LAAINSRDSGKPTLNQAHFRHAVARRSAKLLNRKGCDKALALIDMGKARIVKEFKNGQASFFVTSASGHAIGTPHRNFNYLFDERLAATGNDDGLLPGFHQTGGDHGQG
jgi:hypothetical protein